MGKFERPNGVAFPPSLMRTLKRRPGTLGQRWDASGSREQCLPCLHCVTHQFSQPEMHLAFPRAKAGLMLPAVELPQPSPQIVSKQKMPKGSLHSLPASS